MPAIPALRMNPCVAAFAKGDEIRLIVCAAFSKRELVVDFLGGNVEPALKTPLTQRVLGDVAVADTLPCASISAFGLRAAVISFVAFILLALMHWTISPVRQVGTAGIGAGALRFSWHCFTSLPCIRKALQE